MGYFIIKEPALHFFDLGRSPTKTILNYNADAVAPHAATQRATYTVPAARIAHITQAMVASNRVTVAAPVGRVRVTAREAPAGTNQFLNIMSRLNTVGDNLQMNMGEGEYLETTGQCSIVTEDLSTGGTVDYRASIYIWEFDA